MTINKIRRKPHIICRLFIFMGISVWGLTACGLHDTDGSLDGRNKPAETAVVKKPSVDIAVTVSGSLDTQSSVPNPETAGDKVEVVWYQEDEEVWQEDSSYETDEPPEGLSKSELAAWEKEQEEAEEEWYREQEAKDEAFEKAEERQYIDFSFVGLEQPARVLACQIGCITDSEVSEAVISYTGFRTKRETEKKQGNCLILALQPQTEENEDASSMTLYLAVLDYRKRESYLIETGMFARDNEQLSCLDLDGDGKEEIISFNDPNKAMNWEVYQRKDGQFTNMQYDEEYGAGFAIRLLDNYKAKITCKKLGYEESFSLLDLGFQKKDLEEIPSDKVSDDDTWSNFGRSYKNGKATKQYAFIDSVLSDYRADDRDEVWSCLTKGNAKEGLQIPLNVCLSKYMTIGTVYANLKYVEDTGRLELVGASFRGSKLDNIDRAFMYDYE